jgi:antirestriction protein
MQTSQLPELARTAGSSSTRCRQCTSQSWSSHAFEGVAATVSKNIASTHLSASATQLWDPMQAPLYNSAQVATQRARFTAAVMQKEEAVEEFDERLRGLAYGLPEATSDDVLLQRLREGSKYLEG